MNITPRQTQILVAIIEQYAEVASPVGSVTLAKLFGVSSATIRAEMAKLEEFGFITQPHTSAGRIPTDKGYRFYVNRLSEQQESERFLLNADNSRDNFTRSTQAISLRIQSQKARADQAIRSAVDSLVELTENLGLATIGDQLYINGIYNLFSQPEFESGEAVQSVAQLLDNLEPWLREVSPNEPLNVYIGSENPIGKSSGASLIILKFQSPFSENSYIGVLGPTRQSYGKVIRLVRHTGEFLEEILED
jgi:heat-inducible transcriptional repressor